MSVQSEDEEETGLVDAVEGSEMKALYSVENQYKKRKNLSKPQSALQHLFCPATLEMKEDHCVKVI